MRSLRSQLSFSILFLILMTVTLVSVFANVTVNRQFEEYIRNQEQERSEKIVSDLIVQYNGMTKNWSRDFLHTIGMYSLYDGFLLKVYDAQNEMLWDAENHDMTLCRQIMDDISQRMSKRKRPGAFVEHTYPLTQGGQKIGSVSITYYGPYFFSENELRFLDTFNIILWGIGSVACVFSLAVGWFLARRIAQPISKTAELTQEIAQGNYDIQLEAKPRTKELSNLISAINHFSYSLSEQEKLRKRLTTDVAHELRTPLTAIGSHLEAMLDGLWDPTPQRLRSCHEEVLRLGSLVMDLEHLSKVENENLRLEKSRVNLMETVQTVGETLEAERNKKHLDFQIKGQSVFIEADPNRMSQVITNLLSNAIKYTRDGGRIRIEVKDNGENAFILVEDNGIGIPSEELDLIFERFYRADRSRSRKTGGAGIGLTIAKSIVEAHGGSLSAESREGKGSRFTVTLPKEQGE
ncbi:HAMP domain-containing sensor histidine kinase [Clostridium minihomine]|uniref:HAMP domain-containing sensor histidine kinase n=1 Tax=Clostridium minihomine TaxID=2045012 RepID=UPI000C78A6EC|nr:HAMP domain-containing sensor histidine kinase [Clostridium minihomine]